jgi:hypothetical protein
MALIQSKQVSKVLGGWLSISAFAATAATSNTVTTPLTTAASTAGNDGAGGTTSVPVQISTASNVVGFLTTGANNKVEIWSSTTKKKLADSLGNEVYGRLTEAAGVYTLSYYTLVAGTETAFTMTAGNIDADFPYRYSFLNYPADQAIGYGLTRNVSQDSGALGATIETLTPTALNTLPALSATPKSGSILKLYVNGQMVDSAAGSGLTYSGTAVTWTAATVGFSVTTTDRVIAEYQV